VGEGFGPPRSPSSSTTSLRKVASHGQVQFRLQVYVRRRAGSRTRSQGPRRSRGVVQRRCRGSAAGSGLVEPASVPGRPTCSRLRSTSKPSITPRVTRPMRSRSSSARTARSPPRSRSHDARREEAGPACRARGHGHDRRSAWRCSDLRPRQCDARRHHAVDHAPRVARRARSWTPTKPSPKGGPGPNSRPFFPDSLEGISSSCPIQICFRLCTRDGRTVRVQQDQRPRSHLARRLVLHLARTPEAPAPAASSGLLRRLRPRKRLLHRPSRSPSRLP
jgi:hypothetical protein